MPIDMSKYSKSKKRKITKIKRYIFKYMPYICIVMIFLPLIALENTKSVYGEILIYSSFGTGITLLILYLNTKLISRFRNIRNIREKKKKEEIVKEKEFTQNDNDSCTGCGCGCFLIVIITSLIIFLFSHAPWWAAVIILLLLLH